jgi:hypothetical protein
LQKGVEEEDTCNWELPGCAWWGHQQPDSSGNVHIDQQEPIQACMSCSGSTSDAARDSATPNMKMTGQARNTVPLRMVGGLDISFFNGQPGPPGCEGSSKAVGEQAIAALVVLTFPVRERSFHTTKLHNFGEALHLTISVR